MQQPGGSPYGVPPSNMSPFSSPGAAASAAGPRSHLLTIDPLQPPPPQPQQPQLAEAASPISSRPPPGALMSGSATTNPRLPAAAAAAPGFDELTPAVAANFPDDEVLAAAAGEEAERGGATGNRWPRQETLALLKIRSEMDAAFRDATLKGPLWDEVSRKLAELGYKRSAKKCKEKFENVHKYYKRTKEGRAGRQDGKSYRFFSQLEALHSGGGGGGSAAATAMAAGAAPAPLAAASPTPISFSAAMAAGPSVGRIQPSPVSAAVPLPILSTPARLIPELAQVGGAQGMPGSVGTAANVPGFSFSSNSSSSASLSDSDDEATEEAGGSQEGRKRKRGGSGSGSSRKMMAFFEELMKQVMERQEAMQQRFLETIEKREQDRMIREEAWRRQEMARLTREQELFAQERAMAASRDATLLNYIQKITGQSVPLPTMPVGAISVKTTIPPQPPHAPPTPAPPQQPPQQPQPPHQQKPPMPIQPLQQQPPPQQQQQQQQQQHEIQLHHQSTDIVRHQASLATELVRVSEPHETGSCTGFEPMSSSSSSRWPKAEVHALIKLRSGLESRYQEAGPKGPLWEEISAGMQRLGYSRSSKRCKEKWENINKYFKKVKESNKKRPEDAKTCPYFHQLDALYRKKQLSGASGGSSSAMGAQQPQQGQDPTNADLNLQERTEVPLIMAAAAVQGPQQAQQPSAEADKNGSNNNSSSSRNGGNSESGGGIQVQTSNGGLPPSFLEEGMKKPEDIVKELMGQRHQQAMMDDYDKMEEADSDNMDQEDEEDEDEDDDEDRKMQYKIHFQRQNVGSGSGGSGGGGGGNASTAATTAATTAAGSFMAMVK